MSDDKMNAAENVVADAIDAAEDIHDPLDGLVETTSADPGSPFEPEVLQRLAALNLHYFGDRGVRRRQQVYGRRRIDRRPVQRSIESVVHARSS